MYLKLEVDASQFLVQYPVNNTQDTVEILLSYLYETFTLFGASFQKTSSSLIRIKDSLITPHLLTIASKNSVCFILFSLADTNRISFDFFSCRY